MMTQTHTKQADGSNLFQMIKDGVVTDEWTTPGPTNTWECGDCGDTVERYRGEGDVYCGCGALYNASGQRLRDDAPAFGVGGYWGATPYDDDDY